jgi:NADPH2:quinone reductase
VATQSVKALQCQQLGPDFSGVRMADLAPRECPAGSVRIAVQAAALNFPDLLMTEGGYQHKPALPFTIGMEGAGIVTESAAGRDGPAVGDRVRFSCRSGACATEAVVPAERTWPMASSFSFAEAAGFGVGAITAWVSLVCRGNLKACEVLIVHGASGGMGLAAVQLGAHLGAHVIATGTDPERLAVAKACGAHEVMPVDDGFRERIKSKWPDGVDVIYDPVGGDVFDRSLRVIGWGGRLLVVGFASGRIPQLPVNIPLIKGFSVVGVRAGEYGRRNPTAGRENEQAIQALAEHGVMRPHVGARFALDDGIAALEALRDRQAAGKVVIQIGAEA